jgi:thioredoxin 1
MQKVIRIRNAKTSLFLLFASLGGIIGDKFINGIKIPEWIKMGPKQIKKAFLQGFLGGDGCRVHIINVKREKRKNYNKAHVNPIEFHFWAAAGNSAESFGKELADLLGIFGVKDSKIELSKEDRYERKDKKESMLLKLKIKSDINSIYNYASIGFKYSYAKKLVSAIAMEYLAERVAKSNRDCMDYELWKNKWINGNIAYDSVKKAEKINEPGKFISISLDNDTKMFVANGIIHHNCMPCVMMAPVVEELAERIKKVKFAKVNIDENSELAGKFKVMSIPTMIIFKEGKEVERLVGSRPAGDIEDALKKWMK